MNRSRIFKTIIIVVLFILGLIIVKNDDYVFLLLRKVKNFTFNNVKVIHDRKNLKVSGINKDKLNSIYVFIDGNYKSRLLDNNGGKFESVIDISDLKKGWHYVELKVNENRKTCFFVNVINDSLALFVPDLLVKKARKENNNEKVQYLSYYMGNNLKDTYSSTGIYWGIPKTTSFPVSEHIKLDDNKIPVVCYNKKTWIYNATTISQYALYYYTENLADRPDDYKLFIRYADWLVDNHDKGAYRFNVKLPYRTGIREYGHCSGLSQGQALSVLARAYYLTKDEKYIKAGNEVYNFMIKEWDGHINGTLQTIDDVTRLHDSLRPYSHFVVYEEALTNPKNHVLNGDMIALIGLYDWYSLCPDRTISQDAKKRFYDGVKAIELLLPFYDYYGYSSYDIAPYTSDYIVTFTSRYAHAVHICLLKVLYDLTGSKICFEYYKRFKAYSDDPFFKQTDIMFRN